MWEKLYDVIVAGGGPAGSVAAISAARNGASVLMIEKLGFPGGMATAGMVNPIHTYHNMRKEQIVGGVPDEIVKRLVAIGGAFPGGHLYSSYQSSHTHTPFDVESMKRVLIDMLCEAGVDILLHSFVFGAERGKGGDLELKVCSKSGITTARGRMVVDACGDGDVSAAAGATFEKGGQDGRCMAGSLYIRMGGVDASQVITYIKAHPDDFVLAEDPYLGKTNAELAAEIRDVRDIHVVRGFFSLVKQAHERDEFPRTRNQVMCVFSPRTGQVYLNSANVVHVDGSNVLELSRAEIETRRQVPKIVGFYQKYVPGFKDAFLLETAPHLGVRESRRITGDYILTGEDVLSGRHFEDGIARGAYPSDIHTPDGGLVHRHIRDGRDYHVPYRCLLPAGIDNILVAGRPISADRIAHGSLRVMAQCMAIGQAAGTAAALSVKKGTTPRKLPIADLLSALTSQGAIL